MNIFTPILFVFYLQVMPPPPPPTMHGGGDYWAGQTNRLFGSPVFWDNDDLKDALRNVNPISLPGNRFAIGYFTIKLYIQLGRLSELDDNEWDTFIDAAILNNDKDDACALAEEDGYSSDLCLPLPKELLILSVLSFLLIYYYQNREEFLKLTFFKNLKQ